MGLFADQASSGDIESTFSDVIAFVQKYIELNLNQQEDNPNSKDPTTTFWKPANYFVSYIIMKEFAHLEGKPRCHCGVFGVFGHPEASVFCYYGLHALQHRGQEAAGIVSSEWLDDTVEQMENNGIRKSGASIFKKASDLLQMSSKMKTSFAKISKAMLPSDTTGIPQLVLRITNLIFNPLW